jgi:hypothetical protein
VKTVVDIQDILEVEMPRNQEIVALEGLRLCVQGYVTMKNDKRLWHVGIWEGCRGRPFNHDGRLHRRVVVSTAAHDETMEHKTKRSSGPQLGS